MMQDMEDDGRSGAGAPSGASSLRSPEPQDASRPPVTPPIAEDRHSNEWAICPFCGCEHGDCWEWVTKEVETTCDECGRVFCVYPDFSVTYISYAPKPSVGETK